MAVGGMDAPGLRALQQSSQKDFDSSTDKTAADCTVAQCRGAAVTADEVTTWQKDYVHFEVHAHTTCTCVTQLTVLLQ